MNAEVSGSGSIPSIDSFFRLHTYSTLDPSFISLSADLSLNVQFFPLSFPMHLAYYHTYYLSFLLLVLLNLRKHS